MSIAHQLVTLSNSTPTILTVPFASEPDYSQSLSISIQNLDSSKYAYIGNSGVSSSSYGFRLSPGQSVSFDLAPQDELYAVCSDTSMQVAVIRIQH
jgi:hypothetical protein